MTAGIIIAIVVVVVILLVAVMLVVPRLRVARRERELQQRRDRVADEHRQESEARSERAKAAEHRARVAEHEAQRERAEAQLHEARAEAHEQGLADDQLVEEGERHRFAGTSAFVDRDPNAGVELGSNGEAPADRASVPVAARGSGDRPVE